jgi:uncharacterized membrane protein (Fun14 family)
MSSKTSDSIDSVFSKLPLANISIGVVAGFCSCYAFKAIGRALAVVIGVAFLGLQALQHGGYIQINWGKANDKLIETFDQNGDGKLDAEDVKLAKTRLLPILTKGLPGTAAFSAGFIAAWKWA